MTSQKWLDDSVFSDNSPSKSIWWHYLTVIVPDNLNYHNNGTLYITGGSVTSGLPHTKDEDITVAAAIATSIGVVTGCLFQIPNQKLIFRDDPIQKSRSEDAIIAYTWDHFLKDPSNPEWLVRFPMVKASVRALDAMTEFMAQKLPEKNVNLKGFSIAGASKRGWTTWLMGAVDSRVNAIIPIVLDAVNFVAVEHHQFRTYGGFTYALQDYIDMNITSRFDDPNMLTLQQYEDPYFYFDRLTLPKFIVNSALDEFQQPDDTHYWWNDLPEPKHFLMAGNAEHSCATSILQIVPAIAAFVHNLLEERRIPHFSWKIDESTGEITATVDARDRIHSADVYWAKSCGQNAWDNNTKRRDWRILHLDDPCECGIGADGYCANLKALFQKKALTPTTDKLGRKVYTAKFDAPEDGSYLAFYIDFKFHNPLVTKGDMEPLMEIVDNYSPNEPMMSYYKYSREKYYPDFAGLPRDFGHFFEFTTEVSIWPNTFPYPDCNGAACGDARVV